MAKNQEKWRNTLDFIYAPAQYLEHDGAVHKKTRLGKIFAKATKPEYPFIFLTAMMAAQGHLLGGAILGAAMALNVSAIVRISNIMDKFAPRWAKGNLKGVYYDTQGEIRSYIRPEMAKKLKDASDIAFIRTGLMTVGPVVGIPVALQMMRMDGVAPSAEGVIAVSGGMLSVFWGMAVKSGGEYWRTRQVLDGNWTLLDQAPPEEKSRAVSADLAAEML